jgi:hypothetical protein
MAINIIRIYGNEKESEEFHVDDLEEISFVDHAGHRYELNKIDEEINILVEKQTNGCVVYEKILYIWKSRKDPGKIKLEMCISYHGDGIYIYNCDEIKEFLGIKNTTKEPSKVIIHDKSMSVDEFLSLDILVTDVSGDVYTPTDLIKRNNCICVECSTIMGLNTITYVSVIRYINIVYINVDQVILGYKKENIYPYEVFLKMFQRTPQPKSARNI